jgi:Orsellinic acid/F9775 biosynthesis cluster protein D
MTHPERLDYTKYFVYLHEHKLLVCRDCKHCLQPNGIQLHLQKKHRSTQLVTRKALIEYANGLLLRGSKEAIAPTIPLPVFECLEITNGFQCLICDSLCGTIDDVKKHCRTHDQKTSQGIGSI